MTLILTVTTSFGLYSVGDDITDPTDVSSVQASHPTYVVQTDAARGDSPTPSPPVTSGALASNTPTPDFIPKPNRPLILELKGAGAVLLSVEYKMADGVSYAPSAVGVDGGAAVVLDRTNYDGSLQDGVRFAIPNDIAGQIMRVNPGVVTGSVDYAWVQG